MQKIKFIYFFLFVLLFNSQAIGQATQEGMTVEVTYAKRLGTTQEIRDLVPMNGMNAEKRKQTKAKYKIPKNFVGRFPSRKVENIPHLKGQESVRQKYQNKAFSKDVEPNVNVDGLTDGFSPTDPTGAVGLDHYLQAINATAIGVFAKNGTLLSQFTGNTLWSEIGFSSAGDPIILFDHEFNRWIITEFPDPDELLVAISATSDPLGSYDVYNFSTPQFPDYPKYGLWSNALSVTTNEGGSGVLHSYFINREELMNGEETVRIQRIGLPGTNSSEQGFIVATPVNWTGSTAPRENRPMIVTLNDASWNPGQAADEILVYTLDIDWDDETNTNYIEAAIEVAPYDSNPCSASGFGFACIPQLGGSGLDGLPEIIMNLPTYRNFGTHETIVLTFVTDATDGDNVAGVRWMELRREVGGAWGLFQEGTFAPDDGKERFMGGIAIDKEGNIGLGYSISGEESFVGIGYTGRRVNDPLGEMTINEYIVVEGENSIVSGGRFGDYSQMTVDPTDEKTFWFTSEYAKNGTSTRIVSFSLQPDSFDIGPVVLATPFNGTLSNSETVSFNIENFGLNDISDYGVGFILDNGSEVIENSNALVTCDQGNTHTFSTTVDMSEVGDYEFKIFTILDKDENILNDTMAFVVKHLPAYDIGVMFSGDGAMGTICSSESTDIEFEITNLGTVELNSALIRISNNGVLVEEYEYSGTLMLGDSETLSYMISPLEDGSNEIEIEVLSPNGEPDYFEANNKTSRILFAKPNNVIINIEILTDDYPDETSWVIFDENQSVIANGGPYTDEQTVVMEQVCLDPESCYTFLIADSEGDGIQFQGIEGNYELTDQEGNVLAALIEADFGNSEMNQFCATFECNLQASIDITTVSSTGNDGTIIVTVTNGVGPFMYSLDGGVTNQTSNIFSGLDLGEYTITVTDLNDCVFESIVMLEPVAVFENNIKLPTVLFYPNPTDGMFKIEISGLVSSEVFIPFSLFDQTGKVVERSRLAKYNDKYVSSVNIYPYPPGMYFLKVESTEVKVLQKIVRK